MTGSPAPAEVLYDRDGHVATLTLNRPEQRNAVSPELTTAMDAALEAITNGLQSPKDALDGAAARMLLKK